MPPLIRHRSLQIEKLDDSSPLPPSVASIRQEELRVLENSKFRIRTFNEDPAVPVPVTPKTNILMISPNQDVKCMAYDVWDIIEDLLNDGDHSDHAVFEYSPEFDAESGNRVYSETWTAEWWHRQQISVGLGKNIIALIAYIDETSVTFNGRNMHPVYMYRWETSMWISGTTLFCNSEQNKVLDEQKSTVRQTTFWICSKYQSVFSVQELCAHSTLPPKTHARIDGVHIPAAA